MTSITLEDEFYDVLKQICKEKKTSISDIVTEIDGMRKTKNLSSAVRIYILQELKAQSNFSKTTL